MKRRLARKIVRKICCGQSLRWKRSTERMAFRNAKMSSMIYTRSTSRIMFAPIVAFGESVWPVERAARLWTPAETGDEKRERDANLKYAMFQARYAYQICTPRTMQPFLAAPAENEPPRHEDTKEEETTDERE